MFTKYEIVNLHQVLRYFVNNFEIPKGHRLFEAESYVDTAKDTVVFKLFIQEDSDANFKETT